MNEIEKFYDEFAASYDVIYEDWTRAGSARARKSRASSRKKFPGRHPAELTLLDVSAVDQHVHFAARSAAAIASSAATFPLVRSSGW